MYQPGYRRRNIGPLSRYGRFRGNSYTVRRFTRGIGGYGYPTAYRYIRGLPAGRRAPPSSRGFLGPIQTRSELKFLNTPLQAAGPAVYPLVSNDVTNTNVIGLNLLAQGTDFTNRIGRKVNVRSIQLTMRIAQGTTPSDVVVRFMVVYDSQPNGAVPAISDILDTVAGPVNSFNNLNNRARFKTMLSFSTRLDDQSFGTRDIRKYKACNLPVIYNASGAGVATVNTGAIWFFGVSTNVSGATAPNLPLTQALARIRFSDE